MCIEADNIADMVSKVDVDGESEPVNITSLILNLVSASSLVLSTMKGSPHLFRLELVDREPFELLEKATYEMEKGLLPSHLA